MTHIPLSLMDRIVRWRPPPNEEKYWNRAIETMPRPELMELQWQLLQRQVKYVYERSRLYRKRLEEAGVTPNNLRSTEDFRKRAPITTKDDIRADIHATGDIFGGTLCTPLSEITGFGPSTGTSGEPTQTALTKGDITVASEGLARQLWSFGLRPGDFITNWEFAHPAFHAMQAAYRMLSLPFISLALGSMLQERELDRWTQVMQRLPVKSGYVPYSMLWTYKDYIERKELTPKETLGKMECIFTSGDLITSAMRRLLEEYWETKVHEIQLSSDVLFNFYTCELRNGLHVPEDLFVIEVVDPVTYQPVPTGKPGFLIITPTWTEATCHLRWNSEDIVHMNDEPCPCGRTGTRIWFHGRLAYMVNVQGKDMFPNMVADELMQMPEIGMKGFVSELVKTAPQTQDKLIVLTPYYAEKVKDLTEFRGRIEERLRARFKLPVEIDFMEPKQTVLHKVERVVKRY